MPCVRRIMQTPAAIPDALAVQPQRPMCGVPMTSPPSCGTFSARLPSRPERMKLIKTVRMPIIVGLIALPGLPLLALAQAPDSTGSGEDIPEITVEARRVANTRPAGSYASVATVLRFDPLTELQSRGLPEGQADVTVRGGLFENTGFKAGAVTIMDPQTGHYVAELPVDPAFLSPPNLLTSIDNALAGFNSNVATVSYGIPLVRAGGSVLLGAGSDDLGFGSLRLASIRTSANSQLAGVLSAAASKGDGTVVNGDHEFQRYNLQLQRTTEGAQSDLVLAFQDKFYGWPGAYTGFATLAETDDTKTSLLFANHRVDAANGWLQVAAFYRRLEDDYDFDRTTTEANSPGSFDHETRVYGLGIDGAVDRGALTWNFVGQLTADDLVRSTDLTNSDFTTRSTAKLSVVPAFDIERAGGRTVTLRAGGSIDISNRDSNAISPLLGVTLRTTNATTTRSVTIEYAGTSQLPGYTVLGSGPTGLFGGNAALGREKARQLLVSVSQQSFDWRASAALFYRQDADLVDWTFASASPFARQANPVDLDVFGVELLYGRSWDALNLSVGYTYLDKDADYGSAVVDASFYALNFAKQRATLALRYRPGDAIELRVDNEYRLQEQNALRASSDRALIVAASVVWTPINGGLSVALKADNLTDDDYQQFPGTPAVGRQVSLSARYDW